MSISMEQFATDFEITQMRCVAGFRGLKRKLNSFSIVDTPEIISWLRGGEFVVEAGFISSSHPQLQRNLVRELAQKECAGLGVKLHRYYDKIPDIFIEQGNQYDFPVFVIPYETRFCDLAYEIHKHLFAAQMNESQKIHTLYSKMVTSICAHKNPDRMLYDLSTVIPNPILLVNQNFELIALENPYEDELRLSDYFKLEPGCAILNTETLRNINQIYRDTQFRFHQFSVAKANQTLQCVMLAVATEDEHKGFLIIPEIITPLESQHYQILDNVESLLVLFFQFNSVQRELTGSNDFTQQVLIKPSATLETVRHQCELNHFDTLSKRVCITVSLDDFLQLSMRRKNTIQDIFNIITTKMTDDHRIKIYPIMYKYYHILFLFFPQDCSEQGVQQEVSLIGKELRQLLQQYEIKNRIGVSACHTDLLKISAAFQQTVDIINLGRRLFPEENLYFFSSMQIYHWLFTTMTKSELQELYQVTVAPLANLDANCNSNYIAVLKAYIDNRYNTSKAAAALHMHRNTMIYQMEKIREILQMDLEDQETNLQLQMGLHAMFILKKYD